MLNNIEIKERSDGKFNVWRRDYLSHYDADFADWLWEADIGHNPVVWVVVDVLDKEQKQLVDFVQSADGPVSFEFTVEN